MDEIEQEAVQVASMLKQNYNNAIVDSIESDVSETEDGSETDLESLMSDFCENSHHI